MLTHPHLAGLTCGECQTWIYDLETGKQIERGGRPQRRLPGQATPCHICPKESPERAREHELTDENWRTLRLFLQNRALAGHLLTAEEKADPLLVWLFSLIDNMIRQWESKETARALAGSIDLLRTERIYRGN